MHTRGVYLTQDTSCMLTARVKQEEETDIINVCMKREVGDMEKYRGYDRQSSNLGLNSTKVLTLKLSRTDY